ncbi:YhcB family protein [Psychrobium sp. nBUS_13]|uniref:YhcB family protein n=1 Tax=Psychrobium sp. nBUS_13 TaxID=3395319 RepID=UPI003EC1128E
MDLTINILLIVLAAVIGFIIGRVTSDKSTDNNAEKAKTQQLEAELNQYKQDVEQHFASSAELLGNMAKEYRNVYQHMTQAQQSLLPDSEVSIKIPFKETKETNLVQDAIADVELEAQEAQEAANDEHESSTAQPNDYVQGTHNIITPKANDDDKASA